MTMSTIQQWGRKESIIWPPRGFVYTFGAFLSACILIGFFIYIAFNFVFCRCNVTTSHTACGPKQRA